ncbi:MAG: AhpC/TSA family protein [Prevotellaceae bacterium]|jgi:peroxiredoxin|nr:AhpC/TSA family protein [Prevotellaceae bacterium]
MKIKISTVILFTAIFFVSCTKKYSVFISGTFDNISNEKIVIEQKTASLMFFLDSIEVKTDGKFSTSVKILSAEPAFLSIKNKKGKQLLMLLAEDGEKINIKYKNGNYTVEGSQGSIHVKELHETLGKTVQTIDSLSKIINRETISDADLQVAKTTLAKKIIDQKRNNVRFVVSHPKSYASIFALYQQYPNGAKIFNDENDYLYYKIIIDSMDTKYSHAEYMTVVKRDYNEMQRLLNLKNKLESQPVEEISYPDIELPDRNGKKIKLSSLHGKTILLTFWSSEIKDNQFDNRTLINIYEQYHSKNFEIYQVSFDTERDLWLRAINNQNLTWINVCDFKGSNSIPFGLYNIKKLPSNFIIDKDGQFVARDVFGEQLENTIKSLCLQDK